MAQGVVPFLGSLLDYLQLLDTEMEDYLKEREHGGGNREQDRSSLRLHTQYTILLNEYATVSYVYVHVLRTVGEDV